MLETPRVLRPIATDCDKPKQENTIQVKTYIIAVIHITRPVTKGNLEKARLAAMLLPIMDYKGKLRPKGYLFLTSGI